MIMLSIFNEREREGKAMLDIAKLKNLRVLNKVLYFSFLMTNDPRPKVDKLEKSYEWRVFECLHRHESVRESRNDIDTIHM